MGFIPEDVIAQVLDRTDIVEVVSSFIPLKQTGRNFKACCPFHHEKTPSFVVNQDKQIFHCFGCGLGGNAVTFLMKHDHMEFPDAVRWLAAKTGVPIAEETAKDSTVSKLKDEIRKINSLAEGYFHANLLTKRTSGANQAREYLKKRDIGLEIVRNFHIGYAEDQWEGLISFLKNKNISLGLMDKAGLLVPQTRQEGYYDRFRNRIIFPIFDAQGRSIAFGARTMEQDNPAKYINSPETLVYTKGDHLYGFNWSKEFIGREDWVVVVEGYMDFIVPFQTGLKNIVASLGTALTRRQIRRISRYTKNFIMLFDSDQAGQAAMFRSLDDLMDEGINVKVATLSSGEDPDSYVRTHGVEGLRERLEKADSLFDYKLRYLIDQASGKTIESRAGIATEMLHMVNKCRNAIVQDDYMRRLAQTLQVSYEALKIELAKTAAGNAGKDFKDSISHQPAGGQKAFSIRPAEKELLKLMLLNEEYMVKTKQELGVEDFPSDSVRRIVEKIYDLFDRGQLSNLSSLINAFNDQNVSHFLSGLIASEDMVAGGDKKKIYQDCVNRLKSEKLTIRKLELRNQMEHASRLGDHKQLEELTWKFNQLIKG